MNKLGIIRRGFAKNLSLNVLAVVIMNLVIQFVVYPYLNKVLGEDQFGVVLYLMSIVAILAGSLGGAINNVRLVTKPKYESKNGDYNSILLIFCVVSCVGALIALNVLNQLTLVNALFFCLLMILTLMRYYSDVAFRINLNFKMYFLFYLMVSAGYLLGVALFEGIAIWYIVLIPGELLAILFVVWKGSIYRQPFAYSENRKRVWKDICIVALSYLISNFFLNMDRIVLLNVLGGDAVTTFYTASVLGKTLALLIGPLTGVLVSYLANYQGELGKKSYRKATVLTIVLSAIAFFVCVLVSPWLIQLLYPNVYEQAKGLIVVGTLGQVVFFASSLLLAIILRFYHAKHQFTIQAVYGILYVLLAIPATWFFGLYGFAYATLAANVLRLGMVVMVGMKNASVSAVLQ